MHLRQKKSKGDSMNIVDVANELGLRKEGQKDGELNYYDPSDNNTADLWINPSKDQWFTFAGGQNKGGGFVNLVEHVKGCSREQAKEWLAENFPDKYGNLDKDEIDRRKKAQKVLNKTAEIAQDTLNKRKTALKQKIKDKRRFDDEDLKKAQIGFLSYDDVEVLKNRFNKQQLLDSGLFRENKDGKLYCHLANRIIFPYSNSQQVAFMAGRKLPDSDSDAKYKKLNNTDYNRHILYQFREGRDTLIVTEGFTDCISAGKAGYDVVSPATVKFKDEDILKIRKVASQYNKVILVNDGDEAGRQGAKDTAEELVKAGIEPYVVELEEGYDLDDHTTENGYNLEQLFETSKPYLQNIIASAESRQEETEVKRKIFELTAEWSQIDRNPLFKDLPGAKREIRKEFKEWKENEYEPEEDKQQEKDTESNIEEDNSVTSKLQVEDVEIELNPVSEVRVHCLQKTKTELKANKSGAVKPIPKFKIYSFSFGQGAEEENYLLFTDPEETINPGDKDLAFRQVNLENEHYKDYFRKLYREKDLEISFKKFLTLKSKNAFELAGELNQESKKKIQGLNNQQLRSLVEKYLDNGHEYDERLTQLIYPRIVMHDKRQVSPQDIMGYQPHSMFFTNTKVGKSFLSERVGERRDDITPAGLVGYVSAEDGRKSGILHNQEQPVFADEINFGSKEQLNDELLSLLEVGEVTQSKAGEDLRTRFYGSLTYMANPVQQEDNVEMVEKFLRLIEGLGNNVQAMGSRFGVILFDQNLETVEGTPMDGDKRRKLSTLVDWLKKEVATEYSKIENQCHDWLTQEFPEAYKNRLNASMAHVYSSKIYDFWKAHKESFRHARGQALRMAIYRNHLSDVLNGEWDKEDILEDADKAFMDLLDINLVSITEMNQKLDDEQRMVQRSEAILESTEPLYLKLFVKACIAHSTRLDENWSSYEPFTSLKETWNNIKDEIPEVDKGDRYYKWSRIAQQVSKNRIRKQEELSSRYGLYLVSEQDVDMVKVGNPNTFKPFVKAFQFEIESGDKSDNGDIENPDKNENVCVSDADKVDENQGRTHEDNEQQENQMSQMSPMSPDKLKVLETIQSSNTGLNTIGLHQDAPDNIQRDPVALAKELVENDFLEHNGSIYELTEEGRQTLQEMKEQVKTR